MTQLLSFGFPNILLWAVLLTALWPRLIGSRSGRLRSLEMAVLTLGFFSIPWIPNQVAQMWAPVVDPPHQTFPKGTAVVILAGGRVLGEDGFAWPSERSLRRGIVGTALAEKNNLPLMISGGRVQREEGPSEATLIASAARASSDTFIDSDSKNTWESGQRIAQTVQENGWRGVLLVSDPIHLRRSRAVLLALGIDVVGLAGPFERDPPGTAYRAYIPSFLAYRYWQRVAYEMAASAMYVLRGRIRSSDLFP